MIKRIVLGFIVLVVVVVGGAITALALKKPASRPPSPEKLAATPARIERGKYLVEHVSGCLECHSAHESGLWGWPRKAGTEGEGGFEFDPGTGVPGRVAAQNITSDVETGIGGWTDGEVLRAFREGVSRDGSALFPQMPYKQFRHMGDEDAFSILAYIRTVPARKKVSHRAQLDFPVNLLVKLEPQPLDGPVAAPQPSDGVAYGRYMTTIAGCSDCHTPMEKGKPIESLTFAGGFEFKVAGIHAVSANITPDKETGIGNITREAFIGRFKAFDGAEPQQAPPTRNTIMPWGAYAGMTEQDLGAIYDYLRTLTPIVHKVNHFPSAPN